MGLFGPPNIEKMKAQKDITGLIRALGYKKDNNVRVSSVRALGEIGDAQAVEPLLECLWDDRSVTSAVIFALGKIRDKRTIEPLLQFINREVEDERYFGSRSQRNIENALSSLGKFGSDSVDPLISLFPGSGKYRPNVIKALVETGANEAVEWLITAYKDWGQERQSIVIALGKSGDKRAVDTLIIALKDPDCDLSSTAASSLDSLNWKPDNHEVSAYYWVAKREWSKAVQYGPLAVEPLINVLWDDGNDSNARIAAANGLGEIGPPSLEPLMRTLTQAQYRYQPVARRLGMGNVWSHPDMRPKVLNYCVETLVLIGRKSVDPLRVFLNHNSENIRIVVTEAIKKIS